jgi:hypothetical protein
MLGGLLASACSRTTAAPSPASSSLSVGQWTGTTTQGTPITFTVSSDEILTKISIAYNFNGCSGIQTFADLNVPTAPNIICVPGPCSDTLSGYRAFAYSSGSAATGSNTSINGLFLPLNQAQGQASFHDYPGCGSAGVQWTATRR